MSGNGAFACDLVLLTWNQLELTRRCLESLFNTTDVPVRLLIVDNASEAPVREWLATVQSGGSVREVLRLQNETNEGFSRGMNRGLRTSAAPFVCLLNNDLLFTEGWLREMIDVAKSDQSIGVVNPMSSTLGRRPPRGSSLEAYAAGLRARRGHYVEMSTCSGFCLLIKREVVERVGVLSDEVDRFFFEDEDFCMRVQQAGYRCVVAEGAYVYHAEHGSVRLVPEREAVFTTNQRWCYDKWGRWVRIVWSRFDPLRPGSDELREWLGRLSAWARRRTKITAYCVTGASLSKERFFTSVGMVPHAGIRWRPMPQWLAPVLALLSVLKMRKKRIDIIVAPPGRWAQVASRLRWLHGAEVVPERDEQRLLEAWKRCARTFETAKDA